MATVPKMRRRGPALLLLVSILGACSGGGNDGNARAEDDTPTTTDTEATSDTTTAGGDDSGPPDILVGDVGADEARAVELFTEQFAGYDDPNGLRFTDEEARCAAEAAVQALGLARLVELGFDATAEDLSALDDAALDDDESDAMYQAIAGCIDFAAQLTDIFVQGGIDEAAARCVAERYLETGLAQQSMTSDYDPALNDQIDAALAEARRACGADVG